MDSSHRKLHLPDFLKLLTSNYVPVPKAMAVASKVFKEYNTPALLTQLDDRKLQGIGIKDKDLRKLVLASIHKAGYDKIRAKQQSDSAAEPSSSKSPGPSTVQTVMTPVKKRKRDDDLNELLPEAPADEGAGYGSMDFGEVLDEGVLKIKGTVINRAPLMTAWATIVAERLGFDREEALSIGSVYTEMNAISKGVSLGFVDRSRKKDVEPIPGGQQPYVDLMGRRPLYQTQSSNWRALIGGSPALPSVAFSYISCSFRQTTPYVMGALRLLAESYPPEELNKVGFSLYADFRPTVDEWGKRGEVRCERILSFRKAGGAGMSDVHPKENAVKMALSHATSVKHEFSEGSRSKKDARPLSLEEYDAAFDTDFELDEEDLNKLP